MKKAFAALLCMTIFFQSVITFAYDDDNYTELLNAGGYLAEIIDVIKNNYIGGDVSTQQLLEGAVKGMTDTLDEYSEFFNKEESDLFLNSISSEIYTAGFVYQLGADGYPVIVEALEDMPAYLAGIRAGDKIIAVNGTDLRDKSLNEIQKLVVTPYSREINFTVQTGTKIKSFKVKTKATQNATVRSAKLEDLLDISPSPETDKIRYVQITSFADKTGKEFSAAYKQMKVDGVDKLILDLRGNPGGVVDSALDVCRFIVPSGNIITVRYKDGSTENITSNNHDKSLDKIIVLTNEYTASASEIVASAVKESGAGITMGGKTYGKGVIQSVIGLPDLGNLKLTTMEWISRNGNPINRVGVTPSVEVETNKLLEKNVESDAKEVKEALEIIGYKDLKSFQEDNKLTVTGLINQETIDAINIALYTEDFKNDKVLKKAYEEIRRADSA